MLLPFWEIGSNGVGGGSGCAILEGLIVECNLYEGQDADENGSVDISPWPVLAPVFPASGAHQHDSFRNWGSRWRYSTDWSITHPSWAGRPTASAQSIA
jgi:hypothetical protein